jgi:hypothetical protein
MVMIDSTIVNVALYAIGKDLGAVRGIEWVATSYLLAVCIAQPMMGWIADHLGRKKLFIGSLFLFTLTSVLCALSPSLGVLIFFRFLQGWRGSNVFHDDTGTWAIAWWIVGDKSELALDVSHQCADWSCSSCCFNVEDSRVWSPRNATIRLQGLVLRFCRPYVVRSSANARQYLGLA